MAKMKARCSNCGYPLSKPYTARVFRDDGTEYILNDELPTDDADGKGCVIVLRHRSCRKQGNSGRWIRETQPHAEDFPRGKREDVFPKVPQGIQIFSDGQVVMKRRGARVLMAFFQNPK